MARRELELPAGLVVTGIATGAGVVCTLTPAPLIAGLTAYLNPENYIAADGFNILLDGSGIATAALTVAVNLLDLATGLYVAPATINGITNPFTVNIGASIAANFIGHWPSVQVNIASFGTSTGTFRAMIQAY